MCQPEVFIANSSEEVLFDVTNMKHLGLEKQGLKPIGNDLLINCNNSSVLLTGPNMGGKSTLLRSSCLVIILAQIGAHVPCSSAKISIVDRIFTRIGASDSILEGKSTFYVELEETCTLIKDATFNSFCILDELGRGTSTFDGVAVAYSVLKCLLEKNMCRSLFSTHYHSLIKQFSGFKNIGFMYMDCFVEDDRVVFTYKIKHGSVHESLGINVAKVVGLSKHIIEKAKINCQEFKKIKE